MEQKFYDEIKKILSAARNKVCRSKFEEYASILS